MSQLNPNAEEFVPVSPTRTDNNRGTDWMALKDEHILAQSPRRPSAQCDFNVPEESDFAKDVKNRPSDVYSNGHENGHKQSSQEIMENLLNGKNIEDIEFQPTGSPSKSTSAVGGANEQFIFGPNAAAFSTPTKYMDQSRSSTKANYGDESEMDESDLLDRLNKEKDPMSMSFYQDKDDDETPFDVDKEEQDTEEKEQEEVIAKSFDDSISDLPEHQVFETTDLDHKEDDGVCALPESPLPVEHAHVESLSDLSPESPAHLGAGEQIPDIANTSSPLLENVSIIEASDVEEAERKFDTDDEIIERPQEPLVEVGAKSPLPAVITEEIEDFAPHDAEEAAAGLVVHPEPVVCYASREAELFQQEATSEDISEASDAQQHEFIPETTLEFAQSPEPVLIDNTPDVDIAPTIPEGVHKYAEEEFAPEAETCLSPVATHETETCLSPVATQEACLSPVPTQETCLSPEPEQEMRNLVEDVQTPEEEIHELVQEVTLEQKDAILEAAQDIREPEVLDPKHDEEETVQDILESAIDVTEPIQGVIESVKEIVSEIVKPDQNIVETVQEIVVPLQEVVEPAQEVKEIVHEVAETVQEIMEPVMTPEGKVDPQEAFTSAFKTEIVEQPHFEVELHVEQTTPILESPVLESHLGMVTFEKHEECVLGSEPAPVVEPVLKMAEESCLIPEVNTSELTDVVTPVDDITSSVKDDSPVEEIKEIQPDPVAEVPELPVEVPELLVEVPELPVEVPSVEPVSPAVEEVPTSVPTEQKEDTYVAPEVAAAVAVAAAAAAVTTVTVGAGVVAEAEAKKTTAKPKTSTIGAAKKPAAAATKSSTKPLASTKSAASKTTAAKPAAPASRTAAARASAAKPATTTAAKAAPKPRTSLPASARPSADKKPMTNGDAKAAAAAAAAAAAPAPAKIPPIRRPVPGAAKPAAPKPTATTTTKPTTAPTTAKPAAATKSSVTSATKTATKPVGTTTAAPKPRPTTLAARPANTTKTTSRPLSSSTTTTSITKTMKSTTSSAAAPKPKPASTLASKPRVPLSGRTASARAPDAEKQNKENVNKLTASRTAATRTTTTRKSADTTKTASATKSSTLNKAPAPITKKPMAKSTNNSAVTKSKEEKAIVPNGVSGEKEKETSLIEAADQMIKDLSPINNLILDNSQIAEATAD